MPKMIEVPSKERDEIMLKAYELTKDLQEHCRKLPACHSKSLAIKHLNKFIRAMEPLEKTTWLRPQAPVKVETVGNRLVNDQEHPGLSKPQEFDEGGLVK